MTTKDEKIAHLKDLLKGTLPKRERYLSSSLQSGVPKGAITEVLGTAKIDWMISFLKENPELKVFWIESKFNLFPPALHQRGLQLNRVIFAEGRDLIYPAIRRALHSQAFECVISPYIFKDEIQLKALQLLSERSNTSLFLLSETPHSAWSISLQVRAEQSHLGTKVELMRQKGFS